MKDIWKILFGILFALLSVGLIQLISAPPRGQPVQLVPPPSPAPLVIHVSGAVQRPGVIRIEAGSRVWDVIQAAGGYTQLADREALNLAAFIEDGSQIFVPTQVLSPPAIEKSTEAGGTETPTPTSGILTETPFPRISFPININTASGEELELLPQIGQVRAARILSYRQSHGPFKRIEDLQNIYDITPEVFAAIRDLISVGEPSSTVAPLP